MFIGKLEENLGPITSRDVPISVDVPIATCPLAKTLNKDAPDEDATVKIGSVGWVDVPWTTKVAVGDDEPMPNDPLAFITARVTPVEDVILNGSSVVVPWTLKETVEEEALTPATVPLSMIMDDAVVLAPVALMR